MNRDTLQKYLTNVYLWLSEKINPSLDHDSWSEDFPIVTIKHLLKNERLSLNDDALAFFNENAVHLDNYEFGLNCSISYVTRCD